MNGCDCATYHSRLCAKVLLNLAAFCLTLATTVRASPFDDLASISPDVRSKAAEIIRARHLYHPTASLPWKRLIERVRTGESMQALSRYLSAHDIVIPVLAEEGSFEFSIQLDRSWALFCVVDNSTVIKVRLENRPKAVPVSPPTGYHGFWRTYRVDGHTAFLKYYDSRLPQPETIFLTH
jgi:hypothetical protein